MVIEPVMDNPGAAEPGGRVSPGGTLDTGANPDPLARMPVGLAFGWLFGTILMGTGQAWRIIRFRGRLRAAVPAPENLVEEALRIGRCLGVRVPELLVVPELGTPLLWCLGRPRLLVPASLVKTLGRDRWRGILTHEMAHIRRGDHWVSRLELAAGLIWWWNPVYWLARNRLAALAELACDAWVVSTLPNDRLAYAEALFNICSTLSKVKAPAPALGAAGSGRFFERRLTMILHGHVPCRLSPLALLTACLLALFALPSWSTAKLVASPNRESAIASLLPTMDSSSATFLAADEDDASDDDEDGDDAAIARAKAELKKAEANLHKAEADAEKAKADARKDKTDESEKKRESEFDFSDLGDTIEKAIESNFGPEFEKTIEELGETIEKAIEGNFGPEFEKKIEELGKKIGEKMEARLGPGSDFEKKMKALGKELEAKLGPGSDFEKKMKSLGKDMEAKLGPGSDFEKKMKALGKEMEGRFGPGSDFEKKIKEQAEKLGTEVRKDADKKPSTAEGGATTASAKETAKARVSGKDRRRAAPHSGAGSTDPQTRRRIESPQGRRRRRLRAGRGSRGDLTGLARDLPERQVDSFPDVFLGLRYIVLPVPLHRSGHDDERAVPCRKRLCFPRCVATNPKRSGCSQR